MKQPIIVLWVRQGGMHVTPNEIVIALIVGIPVCFALGRLSTRVTWFHARTEEKYTVQEFIRGRDS